MKSAPRVLAFAAGAVIVAALTVGASLRAAQRAALAEDRFPPVGTLVEVSGGRVHAIVAGAGPDLVMIHGAGGNARDFTHRLVPMLARDYRVIAFDRPGHGYTDAGDPDLYLTPQSQAALLQEAAAALGVTRPIVLGHSYGASVALAWALAQPDATAALVLLAGATMPWPGGLKASYHINASALGGATVVPLIAAFASEDQARDVLTAIFAPQDVPEGYVDHFGLPLSMRRETLRANARQVTHLRPEVVKMSAMYPSLTLPVELLHGDADSIVPLDIHARPLSRRLPDARLTVMEGVGHMPHHADPAAVVEAVNRAAVRAGLHGTAETR